MEQLNVWKILIVFQLRRSRHTIATAVLSPLAIAVTAITVLPYALSRSYGVSVAKSILAGYIPLLAILAALPAAIIAVIEVSMGRYSHLLLSGVSPYLTATAILLVNALASLLIVATGLTISKTLYNFPSSENLGLTALLTFLGTIGVAGLAVTVSYPFRNPQTAGLIISLLVILFEYLSPVYYPISAIPKALANIILAINPLASVMEYLRGTIPLNITLLIVTISTILWASTGAVALAKKIASTV